MAYVDFAPHDLTTNTSHSPFVVTDSTEHPSFKGYKAFDGGSGTNYWLGTNAGVDWIALDIGSGNTRKLHDYSIQVSSIPEPLRAPNSWTMEGSNDGSTWTTLDTRTNETEWGNNETRNYVCSTYTTAYRYFRVNITANNGDSTYTQINELFLYYDDSPPATPSSNMFLVL